MLGGKTAFRQSGTHLILAHAREFLPDFFDAGGFNAGRSFLFKVTDFQIVSLFGGAGQRRNESQNAL